jgi:hypothetical protein
MDDDDMDRREEKWRFKREISTGDLILAIGTLVSAIWWGGKIDARVTVVEEKQAMQARVDAAQDNAVHDGLARIENQLSDIQRYLRDSSKR